MEKNHSENNGKNHSEKMEKNTQKIIEKSHSAGMNGNKPF